jgi:hypothetical protein
MIGIVGIVVIFVMVFGGYLAARGQDDDHHEIAAPSN